MTERETVNQTNKPPVTYARAHTSGNLCIHNTVYGGVHGLVDIM